MIAVWRCLLAQVERHILQGETHLAKQLHLIAELERHRHAPGALKQSHHHERNAGPSPAESGTHFSEKQEQGHEQIEVTEVWGPQARCWEAHGSAAYHLVSSRGRGLILHG